MNRAALFLLLTPAVVACNSSSGSPDAGAATDAGPVDAATSADAAGPTDAQSSTDASPVVDATAPADAATPDAGGGPDAAAADAAPPDVGFFDAGLQASFSSTIYDEDGEGVPTATVTVHLPGGRSRRIDLDDRGGFTEYLPVDEPVFMVAEADGHVPLARGVKLTAAGAIRDFYLWRTTTLDGGHQVVGLQRDPAKGTFYVEFRDAPVGGYSARLSAAHDAVVAMRDGGGFGLPVTSTQTIEGGQFNFLIFPNAAVGTTTVSPARVPAGQKACRPREAIDVWPIFAGAVTQYDFECN